MMSLGETVRLNRKKAGLTQEILAEKLGLSTKYIQFIENNSRKPSLKVVYKMAEVLGTDVCHLFCPERSAKK